MKARLDGVRDSLRSAMRVQRRSRSAALAACGALGLTVAMATPWTESAQAADRPLVLVQSGAGQIPPPSQFSGPPGLIPRTPQGVVPVPIPVPVPRYYGAPTPYGYGAPGYGYPYGGYGYLPGYPSSQPFGVQPYTGPKAGHIQLVIDPVDAQVFIDGHEVKQQSDLTFVVNLLEGRHRLQVARDGYKPYDQPLDVPGGGGFVLAVQLEK